jgi:hypothetical protein
MPPGRRHPGRDVQPVDGEGAAKGDSFANSLEDVSRCETLILSNTVLNDPDRIYPTGAFLFTRITVLAGTATTRHRQPGTHLLHP